MIEQVQPFLHLGKPLSIKLHICHVLCDLPVKITEQGIDVLELVGKLLRPVVIALHAAEFPHRIAHRVRRRLLSVSGKLIRPVRRLNDLSAVCHLPVISLERLILTRCQPSLLDLLILKLRQGKLFCLCPVIHTELRQLLFQLSILLISFPELLPDHSKLLPGKRIQDLHMVPLVQEGLMLMLPVNIDQKLGKSPDLLCRDRLPADLKQISAGLYLPLDNDDPVVLHRDLHGFG